MSFSLSGERSRSIERIQKSGTPQVEVGVLSKLACIAGGMACAKIKFWRRGATGSPIYFRSTFPADRVHRRDFAPTLFCLLGNLSTRRFLRGDGNRKSNLLPIHVSRRQGPPSRLRADFVLLILTSPVKREFRYYDFRAFVSFCLQYFAHSDT